MNALLCAALLLLPAADDEIVATAGPLSLDRQAYTEWLFESFGHVHLEDYVLQRIMLHEAESRGLAPTEDELEAAFREERQGIIDDFFGGDEAAYVEDKDLRGMDVRRHENRRRAALRADLSLVRMTQADRVIDEEELRERFASIYGEFEERVEVEVAFFSLYHGLEKGQRPNMAQADRDARARAQAAARQLAAGEPLAGVLADSDPVASEFVRDGHIAQWREKLLGPECERAVNSLDDPGQVSLPIKVWDGYYVLRLVRREPVTFEGVREELEAMVRDEPPTAEQLTETRAAVKALYPMELLVR